MHFDDVFNIAVILPYIIDFYQINGNSSTAIDVRHGERSVAIQTAVLLGKGSLDCRGAALLAMTDSDLPDEMWKCHADAGNSPFVIIPHFFSICRFWAARKIPVNWRLTFAADLLIKRAPDGTTRKKYSANYFENPSISALSHGV